MILEISLVFLNTGSVKLIFQQKIISLRLVTWLLIRTLLMSNCAPIVLLCSAQGTNKPVTPSPSSTVYNRWFYCWGRQATSSSWSLLQGSSGNVLPILRMLLSTPCLSGLTFFYLFIRHTHPYNTRDQMAHCCYTFEDDPAIVTGGKHIRKAEK